MKRIRSSATANSAKFFLLLLLLLLLLPLGITFWRFEHHLLGQLAWHFDSRLPFDLTWLGLAWLASRPARLSFKLNAVTARVTSKTGSKKRLLPYAGHTIYGSVCWPGRAGLGFTGGKQLVCVLSYQGHAPLSVMPQSTFSCTWCAWWGGDRHENILLMWPGIS